MVYAMKLTMPRTNNAVPVEKISQQSSALRESIPARAPPSRKDFNSLLPDQTFNDTDVFGPLPYYPRSPTKIEGDAGLWEALGELFLSHSDVSTSALFPNVSTSEENKAEAPNNDSPVTFSKSMFLPSCCPTCQTDLGRKSFCLESCMPMDVIMGRGGHTRYHAGNQRFMSAKKAMQKEYFAASTREEKTKISQQLVDQVKEWGGRFLEHMADGTYSVVQDRKARLKASQALREARTTMERNKATEASYS